MRRLGAGGSSTGSLATSSGSSSNGRSNRSLICGKLGELVLTVAQALDVRRQSGRFVGIDDDGVQSRVAGGGFEAARKAGQKTAERGLHFDADDGIVRPRHAGIGQKGGALRQDALVRGLHVRMRCLLY